MGGAWDFVYISRVLKTHSRDYPAKAETGRQNPVKRPVGGANPL
jgi:hypothetical protein